jgi:thymidylate synthase
MTYHDHQYFDMVKHVLAYGNVRHNRTGVDTIGVFDYTMRFDLRDGTIPLLTTKKMHWPSILHELLWYISGSTNNNDLERNGVRIWREWADETGDLGPLYGKMLRDWNGVDQLQEVIGLLKSDPDSRRMVVSYWNPNLLPDSSIPPKANPPLGLQSLAPCHYTWQVYTRFLTKDERLRYKGKDRQMSLKLTQRSSDCFLGVPYNIAQYSILLHTLCHIVNMAPGEFIWSSGDTHIYTNHRDQLLEQILRRPYASPHISFNRPIDSIDDLCFDDVVLHDYKHHPTIKGKVAV